MKLNAVISGIALVWLLATNTMAETVNEQPEAVEILLGKIWAYKMPGTRNIQELEREQFKLTRELPRSDIVNHFLNSLSRVPESDVADEGLIVVGTDLKALREAHSVLVRGEKPRKSFFYEAPLTLVFYSYPISSYVHLRQVQVRGNVIDVGYRFDPYMERNLTSQLALIPLGKLPPGKYRVEIHELPIKNKMTMQRETKDNKELSRRFVCHSFVFDVVSSNRE